MTERVRIELRRRQKYVKGQKRAAEKLFLSAEALARPQNSASLSAGVSSVKEKAKTGERGQDERKERVLRERKNVFAGGAMGRLKEKKSRVRWAEMGRKNIELRDVWKVENRKAMCGK